MLSSRPAKRIAGALLSFAICASSTTAAIAATPTSSISPMVALSAFGTLQSSTAICAAAGAAAATAAAQAAPGAGCVLPVVDQPVPIARPEPVAYVPVENAGGIGLLPLLGGLAVIVGLAALLLSGSDGDGEINFPGEEPMSPD